MSILNNVQIATFSFQSSILFLMLYTIPRNKNNFTHDAGVCVLFISYYLLYITVYVITKYWNVIVLSETSFYTIANNIILFGPYFQLSVGTQM